MDTKQETYILIAGSRYAKWELLNDARKVVQRAHKMGYTVLVGDNPKGVDMAVIRECQRLKAKVIVAGVSNFPRNGGCKHGSYVQVDKYLYRGMNGSRLHPYTVRDRWMVDNATLGVFVWNGDSPGTKSGYDYMISRGKEAHLIEFS